MIVNIYFYDKNLSVRTAFQQAKQIAGVGDSLISNFEYAMEHLVPRYNEVFFFHSKIDKMECIYSVVRKKYSDTIVYEIMVDHSNGFHKHTLPVVQIHPSRARGEGIVAEQKNTVIEKFGLIRRLCRGNRNVCAVRFS